MNRSRLVRSVVATAGGVLLLSGCAGGLQPGDAAHVGDRSVSRAQVDRAVEGVCLAEIEQIEAQGAQFANAPTRQRVAQTFVVRTVADAVADEYDVEAGPEYNATRSERLRALKEVERLPEEYHEDLVDVYTADAYVQSVMVAVGSAVLADEGVADPDMEEAAARGQELFGERFEAADVEYDPRYGLADGNAVSSQAVSFAALQGVPDAETGEANPDPDWVMGLPASQRCG